MEVIEMEVIEKTAGQGAATDTNSEQWRHECEARSVMALPTASQRQNRLQRIEKVRGADARQQLEATMQAMREKRAQMSKAALNLCKSMLK